MRTTLKISLILNLISMGCLVYFLINQRSGHKLPESSSPVAPGVAAPQVAAAATQTVQAITAKPFRWSQLESADYRVYIRNLRNFGCPEPTLRAIVAADVDVVYRQCGGELERKLAVLANSSWAVQLSSYNDQQALKAELQRLPDEENVEIADLLGLNSNALEVAGNVTLPTPNSRQNLRTMPIVEPLVFRNVDLAALNFNEEEIEAIKDLRQTFVDEIGGPNQDPNDPVYRERWQNAQLEIDGRMRGLLGVTAYEDYQVAAEGAGSALAAANP
jgi:hypothetical protein